MREYVTNLTALIASGVLTYHFYPRWPSFFFLILFFYLLVPTLLAGVAWAWTELMEPMPPVKEFESIDEAEMWFLSNGYEVIHECDTRGGHIRVRKNTALPGYIMVYDYFQGKE